jgi:hypothetical protein
MGVENPPHAVFTVYRDAQERRARGPDPSVLYAGIVSPHAGCCLPPGGESLLVDAAASSLVEELFYWQAGISRLRGSDAIVQALLNWEYTRLGLDDPDEMLAVQGRRVRAPQTLDALWEADTEYDDLGSRIRAQSLEIGAQMLVEMLVEQYGEAAYPQLVEWLGEADSLPHWLTLSLGVSADEIAALEAEWYSRYADTLVEMGYEIEY